MNAVAGYSGTPLAKKLGIKANFRVKTRNAPDDYECAVDATWSGLKLVIRKALR